MYTAQVMLMMVSYTYSFLNEYKVTNCGSNFIFIAEGILADNGYSQYQSLPKNKS
jgi:hypothetical protein